MLIFALRSSRYLGEGVASRLGVTLGRLEELDFDDGEHMARPLENVRGRDVFVIQALFAEAGRSVDDKLCRLCFFISALKDAHARRVTAVIPYLAYARKDRSVLPREPVTLKYVARLLEAAGLDAILTLDVHNLAAFQNAFRIPSDHLEARVLFAPLLAGMLDRRDVTVVSPDAGGIARAQAFRSTLGDLLGREVGAAFMEKQRVDGGVRGGRLAGEVAGRTAVIVDDILSTGATLRRAVETLRAEGAGRILAAVTHGIFAGTAVAILREEGLERMLLCDSVRSGVTSSAKVMPVHCAALLAGAIRQLADAGSISRLLADFPGQVRDDPSLALPGDRRT